MDVGSIPADVPPGLEDDFRALWQEILSLPNPSAAKRGLLVNLLVMRRLGDEALQALSADGLIVTGSAGQSAKHPAWEILTQASDRQAQLAALLGLVQRPRTQVAPPDRDDDPNNPWRTS